VNKNILNNSDGFLTADYIFAVVLAGGFMIILFSLSMTLTVVDVVQYMTFSSARVYTASNVDESTSRENAEIKFGQLRAHPSISPLFERAKWFEFTGANFGDLRNNFTVTDPNRNLFYGVSVGLKAEMLDFKVPFFGSTNNRDDGQGFTTQSPVLMSAKYNLPTIV